MKRSLIAIIALLMIAFANQPVWAQNSKLLNAGAKFGKNPVRYARTAAFSDGKGVWLEWETAIESQNLGFYIYRVVGEEKELVSPLFTPGAYLQAREEKITSGSYSFFDRFGDVNSTYIIESNNLNGQKHYSNLIQTQYINDLKIVAGTSSTELIKQAEEASPIKLQNESVLPAELAAEVDSNTPQSDPIKQLWVAAQPGAKIGVKSEGLYRVSRADLQTAGFDVNAPTARWQLYVNGTEQAIAVGNNGDYIEFYGKGIDRLESDTQIYFLVVGPENGKRIGTTTRRRVGSDSVLSESYLQTFSKRERFFYTSNIFNGDAENVFGTPISQTTPSTVNFDLSNVDFNVAGAAIDIAIQGASLLPHQTKVTLNNVEIGVMTGNGHEPSTKRFEFLTSVLREGANSLKFTPMNGPGDTSYFNSLKVTYSRRYQAEQNRISFHVPNYKGTYAGNFTSSNIRVFDTTNPAAPVLITGLPVEENGGSYRVFLPSNRGRVMYAIEDTAILQPFSITSNAASTLSTPAHQADLIILSHKKFLVQAEEWASYRRQQGMNVEVIDIADVYDEFNFGVTHADSIRTFLQYAKSNWQIAPNYVLLIGDATFDPKNYFGLNANYVSTRFVDTVYSETGSDETMADFNDDGLAEIAIGRIPARETEEVTRIFNKLKAFELTVQTGLNRGATFAYDLPDGYDFQALSLRLSNQLSANTPRALIGREMPNAQTQLLGALNNGPFIVNYSGHGNVGVWAATGFFSSTNAGQLTNSNLSMFTLLTCLNGYFINPNDSLSEHLLKNPNGGAVMSWASTGLTTPDVQEVMATRFYNQIAVGNITRIGDLIKDAKTRINSGRDVRLSWALLGDPTMKVK